MRLNKLFRKRHPAAYLVYSAVILLGIAIDQLTKWLAVKYLTAVDTVPIIKGVIHLTYVENRGAAFGSFKDSPWVFNTISVIAITAMLLYLYLGHGAGMLERVSIAMIASGGIGNMIDRATLKYVVDFIDFRLINFAVFNGADCFVCVGAGLLILSMVIDIVKEYRANKSAESTE